MDLYDVQGIVLSCLAHPGAVQALVTVIERFHPGSNSVRGLRDLVTELLPEPLLLPDERRDLYQLASELQHGGLLPETLAMLPLLYREVVGPVGPAPDRPLHDVRNVLAELEDLSFPLDEPPPLLKFVEPLARGARDPGVTAALCAWRDRVVDRLGLPPVGPSSALMPPRHAPDAEGHAYLVIECRQDGVDPRGVLTSAWLQYHDEPGTVLVREELPRTLDELPGLVERLLNEDTHVVNRHVPELTVEFVLPRHLLSTPVDQYSYRTGRLSRRLGLQHPVVVRSLERLRDRQLRHGWQEKWSRLVAESHAGEATWVRVPGECDEEWLYAVLLEESNVCLALAFPPRDDTESADELEVGLQAGVPVILWNRQESDPERFVAELEGLLSTELLSLPRRIHKLRRKAVQDGSPQHPGNHLTLLFEDADRMPEPYLRLRPPDRAGRTP